MADLLALCRDYFVHNRDIKEESDEIIFDNYAWPSNAKTNYAVWSSEKNGAVKEYYTLKSIVYFLKNSNLTHAQLVRQSASSGVLCIRLPDRQKLLDYLHGRITTCDSIDHSVPLDISQRRLIVAVEPTPVVQSGTTTEDAPPNKRMCLVGDVRDDLELTDPILATVDSGQQRLAAKLDLPPGGKLTNSDLATGADGADGNKPGNITSVMSEARLQMLRAKFRANHQQMIKPDDMVDPDSAATAGDLDPEKSTSSTGMIAAASKPYSAAKLQLGSTKQFVKDIMGREYTWRTRDSVLQSQKKTFFDSVVMGSLKAVKMREENLHGHGHHLHSAMAGSSALVGNAGPHTPFQQPGTKVGDAKSGQANGQPQHYSRYDQERFTGAGQDTAGFKIDTMGSYHGKGLSSMMTEGGNPAATRDPRRHSASTGRPSTDAKTGGTGSTTPSSGTGKTKPKSRVPIIIIPAAPTSLITMYNARDILQDLKFETTEEKKAAAGSRRDNEILIQRLKTDGRTVPYRVIDQPGKLSREDWDRVVAVFVQGPAWQFKNWPLGRDPVEIFSVVKAFHLKYAHMPTHADVKKWNVHVIQLDSRRHLDKANFQQIWDILDRHMMKTKPGLRF